ncbi:hypothetical protein CA54_52430 [Symmachiella macrocystis]|uniref:DUF4291 domain-containing protein n=1 Tax=Symmachiella macrocystis TaxID=2527985 RepID=A0A5C6B3W1_9PLAN|nr:DUF4291 domain-containing protein [Symmachiella macrocystis]TWU06843.1 hypothetical protein CA54_52430 [Symmachiella macrocystis]
MNTGPPLRQIRAQFDDQTIRVYQAYSPQIATRALRAQTFVSPFKMSRMTWIKPSFLWMMYRCGWGTKPGQERVLAIDISREGFEWALRNSCLSHFDAAHDETEEQWSRRKEKSPVRIQWDPERDVRLERMEHRSIQIGLSEAAIEKYVHEWIQRISDVTDLARRLETAVANNDAASVQSSLPVELPYSVPSDIQSRIGMQIND